ncbi:MAG TPA: hypothetical protein DCO89_00015 [Clostridiales bacterium]|nr:hypothetical protein [Clostridiales bacterium]
MKITSNITEWMYSNLDLIEECKEKGLKPIILIGGASSSGKSYSSKMLKNFLTEKGFKTIIISTDNYNKGLAENIFDIVNKKYYNKRIKNRPQITNEIKKIILNCDFDNKFDKYNLSLIKNACVNLINYNIDDFTSKLEYEFKHINFDKKEIYNLEEAASDITALIGNKRIIEKKYSKMVSERIEQSNILDGKNFDIIMVEGIYALADEIIKNINTENVIKNFIDCKNKNLFLRRMIRDNNITNCSKGFILKNYLDYVAPEYFETVLQTKQKADIIFKNDMTFEELREGYVDIQNKYKITTDQLNAFLLRSKIIKKLTIIDTYFGERGDANVLRLREEKTPLTNLTMKSLIYKGNPKLRKDKSIIRPNFVLATEKDLYAVFKNRSELIAALKTARISIFKMIQKKRWLLNYKGKEIKVDFVNNDIIMEVDEELEKDLDPIIKVQKIQAQRFYEL